jgi:hypothetical protein
LQGNLDYLTREGVEHQPEIFDNFHITPSFKLTRDLEIILLNPP